ncbi:hypothetical protein BASA50_011112 [Batrachochytrium salamandrivorans]|uniref:Uncharacterized protein n=1 Tax=Batrachochytrium salamandrivorans TaxID=1357716 RepID=A0ABQ8EWK3_9FUNG|nr:hypothetical protein BASA62_005630 [Batrachochytrium salamandrivorans]KAH6587810.1 hypothetical protein BASA50_011112 [Batrachochytrium salamandrivorans]KAH9264457.1 hypothetical protein BASA83_012044 [Batrachochytrium salamandrivorans]
MRVGTGIILSVLSCSVLAAVIPNYDDHGILLARRTVNPETMDLLWKRADEDQEEPGPSSSGAGADDSNDESSSSSSRSKSMKSKINSSFRSLTETVNAAKYRQIKKRGDEVIQRAMKKVARIIEGKNTKAVLLEIETFLNNTQKGAWNNFEPYINLDRAPFLLVIPKGKNKKSLLKEMTKIQNTAKKHTKENLRDEIRARNGIDKIPKNVVRGLEAIKDGVSRMHSTLKGLYDGDYKDLIFKVGRTGNEKNIKYTEAHMFEMKKYLDSTSSALDSIKNHIKANEITFEG